MSTIWLQLTEEVTEQDLDTNLEEDLEPNCRVFLAEAPALRKE